MTEPNEQIFDLIQFHKSAALDLKIRASRMKETVIARFGSSGSGYEAYMVEVREYESLSKRHETWAEACRSLL